MGILKLVEVSENFREQVLEYKDEFDLYKEDERDEFIIKYYRRKK